MAELSPETAARIDQLRSSYEGNPARFFMPLASAYREAGDLARAEELLRENLKRHPGHQSAHVLLGRCLAERGALAEATNEFRYVLSVDPQNLVALRTLGEMAATQGNRDEASRWYRELLAVDPMNTEARQALDALAQVPAAPAAATEGGAGDEGWGNVELGAEAAAGADTGSGLGADFGEVELAVPGGEGVPAGGGEAPADVGAWGEVSLDADGEPAAPAEAAQGADFNAFQFGSVDLSDEAAAAPAADAWSGASADAAEGSGSHGFGDVAGERESHGFAGAAGGSESHGFAAGGDDGPGFDEPAHAEADEGEEMVTETMAELYARQGFHARAVEVYRELIARRGEEPNLVRRLAELEQAAGIAPRAPQSQPQPPQFELQPEADLAAASEPEPADVGPPSWLQQVEAVSRGEPFAGAGTPAPAPDAGLPAFEPIDLEPYPAGEPVAAAVPAEAEPADLSSLEIAEAAGEPVFAEAEIIETAASAEPEPVDLGSLEIAGAAGEPVFAEAEILETAASAEPEPAAASADAGGDVFADSFHQGFPGADAELEPAAAGIETAAEPWATSEAEAPPAAEVEVATPAWTTGAAAPSDEAAAEAVAEPPVRTMAGYLSSLLSWRPSSGGAAPSQPASAPAAAPPSFEQPAEVSPFSGPDADGPAPWESPADAVAGVSEGWDGGDRADDVAAAEPWAATASEAEEDPWASSPPPFAEPTVGTDADAGDEAAAADAFGDPWASPAAPAPDANEEPVEPADELPWLADAGPEAPVGPAAEAGARTETPDGSGWEPADVGDFTFEDTPPPAAPPRELLGTGAEERMPWESFELADEAAGPAPGAAPAQPEAPAGGGGFSFEDFFAEGAAAPEVPAQPEPPAPAPAPQAAAPAPAAPQPPAPPAAKAADEDDEDLESFQAWLQSLKR